MSNKEPLVKLLSLSEAAKLLNCHPNTLRNWDEEGILPALRVGRRRDRRYREDDLLAFMSANSEGVVEVRPMPDTPAESMMGNIPDNAASFCWYLTDDNAKEQSIPLFTSRVAAGFPTPTEDAVDQRLDLNQHLVRHPVSTFFVKVEGESMINAGIHDGDMLIVDRSQAPSNDQVVIAVLDGELTVKRLFKNKGKVYLIPENPKFPKIEIQPENDFQVWGVVTHVIHSF